MKKSEAWTSLFFILFNLCAWNFEYHNQAAHKAGNRHDDLPCQSLNKEDHGTEHHCGHESNCLILRELPLVLFRLWRCTTNSP